MSRPTSQTNGVDAFPASSRRINPVAVGSRGAAAKPLRCGRYLLDVSEPQVMGIVNLTDDSFSGDGFVDNVGGAVSHALRLRAEGAAILDIGAESSRPGATAVPADVEIQRLLPVIRQLIDCGIPLSIDTAKPEVMRAVLDAGADMINDVNGLCANGAMEAVAGSDVAVCLMHRQGTAATMQVAPKYDDVVAEVQGFLLQRVRAANAAGITSERIVVDPGFGFGKTLEHNLLLLEQLRKFDLETTALMIGISRKSMLGQITGRGADARIFAGLAAHILAVQHGARIVRTHDVAATMDAFAVLKAANRSVRLT